MNESLKKLWETIQSSAGSLADSAAATVSYAGEKATELVNITQLNLALAEKKSKMNTQLREVGQMVYATHTGDPTDSDDLLAKLSEIDETQAAINDLQTKINAARGIEICVVCGAALREGDQFCRECGTPR